MTRYRRGVSRRYLRPGVLVGHVLVLAAALTCLRLGWWQWNVFEAARGTAQNLGYALLWPVFAGSFIYMWLRFLQLESTREAQIGEAAGIDTDNDDADDALPVDHDEADVSAPDAPAGPEDSDTRVEHEQRHTRSSNPEREVFTVGVGYIDDADDDDDPELAAYNRALAALAEQDERRAR